jgi:ABC-type Mn2+/Zn2+ transport system ATPase subunit
MSNLPRDPAHLEIENVSVAYNGAPVLRDVSFRIPHGTRIAVVGPNGAGKSTLFKALVGLLPLRAGRVLIHGLPLGHHLDCVAYVPQREEVDWRFPVTVTDVVMMGRYGRLGWLRRPGKQDHVAVARALDQMRVRDLAAQPIGDLSGGQQQRVFLARALAQEPHILLMDEPFTGVDAATQEATLDLLDQLREQKVTVMVSTHDLNLATTRFDQVLLLNRDVISVGEPRQVFTEENLSRAFGTRVMKLDHVTVVDDCCPPDELLGIGVTKKVER